MGRAWPVRHMNSFVKNADVTTYAVEIPSRFDKLWNWREISDQQVTADATYQDVKDNGRKWQPYSYYPTPLVNPNTFAICSSLSPGVSRRDVPIISNLQS
jgi:hypothetical protein